MGNTIIRQSDAKPVGGNLDDVQVAFRVSVIDEDTGVEVDVEWLQFSSKGLGHDPARVREFAVVESEKWAAQNAERIEAKYGIVGAKAAELDTVRDLVDAINAAPDVVKPREDLAMLADVAVEGVKKP